MEVVEANAEGSPIKGAGGDGKAAPNASDLFAAALAGDGDRQEVVAALPEPVRRRLRALRKLQLAKVKLEAEFYKRVHDIECTFASQLQPLYEKRRDIVSGKCEPSDEDADFALFPGENDNDDIALEWKQKAALANGVPDALESKGVPDFWLSLLKNSADIFDMIQEHDEPILKHLMDIELKTVREPPGFKLEFHFTANEFFTNSILTKEYSLRMEPKTDDPFDYDGPEIFACSGCKIDWKSNKNVTMKLIKKKQKHKQKSQTRFVTKQVKNDSFFNFFDPPVLPADAIDESALDDETRLALHADFEMGQTLRDRLIPRAVLFFTGEAEDDDDSFDEDEEGDVDESDDDDDAQDDD